MTSQSRFEQQLPDLLADLYLGPAPEYRSDILARTAAMPQRAAWEIPQRWLPVAVLARRRFIPKPIPWRPIATLVALGLLLAAIAGLFAGSSTAPVPEPFGPARNGALAVEHRGRIVVVDPDSGARRTLIDAPEALSDPAFSRDGTRLAFLRRTDDTHHLWLANADGSGLARLTVEPVTVAQFQDRVMDWAPDGSSILLYTGSEESPTITIVPTDGTGPPRALDVGMPAIGPTWRPPDGAEILFGGQTAAGTGLFAIRPDGTGLRELVTAKDGPHPQFPLSFEWSPDGAYVAYTRADERLYVIPSDGGEPRALTTEDSVGAKWSPDGRYIAVFDTSEVDAGGNVTVVLAIVPSDGLGPPRRTNAPVHAGVYDWSPDGTSLIFTSYDAGQVGPTVIDLTTGTWRSTGWLMDGVPSWQRLAP